eukprot:IDg11470t1
MSGKRLDKLVAFIMGFKGRTYFLHVMAQMLAVWMLMLTALFTVTVAQEALLEIPEECAPPDTPVKTVLGKLSKKLFLWDTVRIKDIGRLQLDCFRQRRRVTRKLRRLRGKMGPRDERFKGLVDVSKISSVHRSAHLIYYIVDTRPICIGKDEKGN